MGTSGDDVGTLERQLSKTLLRGGFTRLSGLAGGDDSDGNSDG
jgi:hypothetical protein